MHGVSNYETLYDGSEVYTEERQVIEDIQDYDKGFYRIHNSKITRNYLNLPSALSYMVHHHLIQFTIVIPLAVAVGGCARR